MIEAAIFIGVAGLFWWLGRAGPPRTGAGRRRAGRAPGWQAPAPGGGDPAPRAAVLHPGRSRAACVRSPGWLPDLALRPGALVLQPVGLAEDRIMTTNYA